MSTSSREIDPLSIKSISLPGQATKMSTPRSNALNCLVYETPPYTAYVYNPSSRESGSSTLKICSANSLVGVRIREVGKPGSACLVRSISGNPKARVFPEPVGALQHKS